MGRRQEAQRAGPYLLFIGPGGTDSPGDALEQRNCQIRKRYKVIIAGHMESESTPASTTGLQPTQSASEKIRRSEFAGCSHSQTEAEKTSIHLVLPAQNPHPERWDTV